MQAHRKWVVRVLMREFISLCLLFLIVACGMDNGAVSRESVPDWTEPDVQIFGESEDVAE